MLTENRLSGLTLLVGEVVDEGNEEFPFDEHAAIAIAGAELARAFADVPDLTEADMYQFVLECLPQVLSESNLSEINTWTSWRNQPKPAKPSVDTHASRLQAASAHAATHSGHLKAASKAAHTLTGKAQGGSSINKHLAAAHAHGQAAAHAKEAGHTELERHHSQMAAAHSDTAGAHSMEPRKPGLLHRAAKKIAGAAFGAVKGVAKAGGRAVAGAVKGSVGAVKGAATAGKGQRLRGAKVGALRAISPEKRSAIRKFVSVGHKVASAAASGAKAVGRGVKAAGRGAAHLGKIVQGATQGAVAAHKAGKVPKGASKPAAAFGPPSLRTRLAAQRGKPTNESVGNGVVVGSVVGSHQWIPIDEMDMFLEGFFSAVAKKAKSLGQIAHGAVRGAVSGAKAGAKAAQAHQAAAPRRAEPGKAAVHSGGWSVSAHDIKHDPNSISKAVAAHRTLSTPAAHTKTAVSPNAATKPKISVDTDARLRGHAASSGSEATKVSRAPPKPTKPPPLAPALARARALKKKANEDVGEWLLRFDEFLAAA